MSGPTASLDDAVDRVRDVYASLDATLPALVSHLESLDPSFDHIPTVSALRLASRDYVESQLLPKAVTAAEADRRALDTFENVILSGVETALTANGHSAAWPALLARAAQTVCETHAAREGPAPTRAGDVDTTTANDSVEAPNVLQLDAFNLWSPGSHLADGSDDELRHGHGATAASEVHRAMSVFERYVQQLFPHIEVPRDAGSSDSALFPEYRADALLEESASVDGAGRPVSASEALQCAEKVLSMHHDWLTQHTHWDAVSRTLVHATVAAVDEDSTTTVSASSSLTRHPLDEFFRASGPAHRFLVMSELCERMRAGLPSSAVDALVPVILDLARHTPEDWLTWLESEVLQVFRGIVEHVVLPYPTQCAGHDPAAEWVAQWAARPAFAITVVVLLTEHATLLERVATAVMQSPSSHLAVLTSYLLPIMAAHNAKVDRGASAGPVVAQLCDAVIAFVLRRGLPAMHTQSLVVSGQDDASRVCTSSIAQMLRTAPRGLSQSAVTRWCGETLRIVELQLDNGVEEANNLRLLAVLLVHVDVSVCDGHDVLTHLDEQLAPKIAQGTTEAFVTGASDFWQEVLPRHAPLLPSVLASVVKAVEHQCRRPHEEGGNHDTGHRVYSVRHLVALSRDAPGWMLVCEALTASPLCAISSDALTCLARSILDTIVRGEGGSNGGTVTRLTAEAGVLLHRWCSSSCGTLRGALLAVARSRQLLTSKKFYHCDGGDSYESLAFLDEWLLTIPAELAARDLLETPATTQALLDVALLDQRVFLLLLLAPEPGLDGSVVVTNTPFSGDTAVQRLLGQYATLSDRCRARQEGVSAVALSLPFGLDSQALLLRLLIVVGLTHPTVTLHHSSSCQQRLRALTESKQSHGGVDAVTVLRCFAACDVRHAALERWWTPLLLCGFGAAVDEDALMASLSTHQAACAASPCDVGVCASSAAEQLCLSVFPEVASATSSALSDTLQALCRLALKALADEKQTARVLGELPANTWATICDTPRRARAVAVRVLRASPDAEATLRRCGADIFTLAHIHIQRMLTTEPGMLLSKATTADGSDGVDEWLSLSFAECVDELLASPSTVQRLAWCQSTDNLLPVPSPLFLFLLTRVSRGDDDGNEM